MAGFRTRRDGRVFPVKEARSSAVRPVVFARHPENLSTSERKRLSVSRSPTQPNKISVRELELFATNDGDLYKQQFVPIVKNLENKRNKGTYDRDKGRVAFLNFVENAARKYDKEFGGGRSVFSKADKLAVAGNLERDYRQESDLGNYKNANFGQ